MAKETDTCDDHPCSHTRENRIMIENFALTIVRLDKSIEKLAACIESVKSRPSWATLTLITFLSSVSVALIVQFVVKGH